MRSEIGFGRITTFHAMMELGIPVVKPDRMLVRTISRLGLLTAFGDTASRSGRREVLPTITSEEALDLGKTPSFVWELQPLMRDASQATGRSVREVDWLFAKMGMTASADEGRETVVCDTVPKCSVCLAHRFCALGRRLYKPVSQTVPLRARKSKSRRLNVRVTPAPARSTL
jgi:hypothetical protein